VLEIQEIQMKRGPETYRFSMDQVKMPSATCRNNVSFEFAGRGPPELEANESGSSSPGEFPPWFSGKRSIILSTDAENLGHTDFDSSSDLFNSPELNFKQGRTSSGLRFDIEIR
jgi:hypothetical protein